MSLANRSLPPSEPSQLGNNIYLFEPQNSDTVSQSDIEASPPRLIILCTWLGGATTPRVNKFATGYRVLYLTAHVLLIRTVFLDISVSTCAALRAKLEPARDAILTLLCQHRSYSQSQTQSDFSGRGDGGSHDTMGNDTDDNKDVLLHILSHGGCSRARQLAWSMREAASFASCDSMLLDDRLHLVVFDCCAGDDTFDKAYSAALLSLPPYSPLRTLGAPLVYGAVALVQGLHRAGLMRSVRELRRELNDPAAFGRHARRLYLYSRDDVMVAAEDVQAHTQEARGRLECAVRTVGSEDAAHCVLVREDTVRY